MRCILEWLGLNPDCKRMLNDETKTLETHQSPMRNKAILIFQQAVNEDPKLLIEAQVQIPRAVYVMNEVKVRFDTRLGNISSFTSSHRKGMADTESGRSKRVCMK